MAVVLVVEDDSAVRTAFTRGFEEAGYIVRGAGLVSDALRSSKASRADLLVLDLRLPDGSALDVFDRLNAAWPGIPGIIVTGFGDQQTAFAAGRRGIKAYLQKPVSMRELLETAGRALAELGLGTPGEDSVFGGILGTSPAVCEVRDLIGRFAREPGNVLIRGETGTGKELTARALHERSGRSGGPYVPVNCAAITDSLFESELFGHERGAFTGAVDKHVGLFEAAHGGTLFLDEVAEMSPTLQVKLLRAVDERAIRRVGSTRPTHVDVRIVAATNRNVDEEAAAGRFREDLLYRLDQLSIQLPPLRERLQDIPVIAEHLLAGLSAQHGRDHVSLSVEALRALQTSAWPGNVRQLENVVRKAFVWADGAVIDVGLVSRHLRATTPTPGVAGASDGSSLPAEASLQATLEATARWRIQRALEGSRTIAAAAKELGIEERTLYNKRRRLGL